MDAGAGRDADRPSRLVKHSVFKTSGTVVREYGPVQRADACTRSIAAIEHSLALRAPVPAVLDIAENENSNCYGVPVTVGVQVRA